MNDWINSAVKLKKTFRKNQRSRTKSDCESHAGMLVTVFGCKNRALNVTPTVLLSLLTILEITNSKALKIFAALLPHSKIKCTLFHQSSTLTPNISQSSSSPSQRELTAPSVLIMKAPTCRSGFRWLVMPVHPVVPQCMPGALVVWNLLPPQPLGCVSLRVKFSSSCQRRWDLAASVCVCGGGRGEELHCILNTKHVCVLVCTGKNAYAT